MWKTLVKIIICENITLHVINNFFHISSTIKLHYTSNMIFCRKSVMHFYTNLYQYPKYTTQLPTIILTIIVRFQ